MDNIVLITKILQKVPELLSHLLKKDETAIIIIHYLFILYAEETRWIKKEQMIYNAT